MNSYENMIVLVTTPIFKMSRSMIKVNTSLRLRNWPDHVGIYLLTMSTKDPLLRLAFRAKRANLEKSWI